MEGPANRRGTGRGLSPQPGQGVRSEPQAAAGEGRRGGEVSGYQHGRLTPGRDPALPDRLRMVCIVVPAQRRPGFPRHLGLHATIAFS